MNKEIAEKFGTKLKVNYSEFGIRYNEYTCKDCSCNLDCNYAFDAYNTNGDCLAEK